MIVRSGNMEFLTYAMLLVGLLSGYCKAQCSDGYEALQGDVPGWGSIKSISVIQSTSECGRKCEEISKCHSYEWSPTEKKCNLNQESKPTVEKYKDYVFCTHKLRGQGKCIGGDSCCSASNKCGPMEGDCDNDDDCKDGYACGTNNCPKWASFEDSDDCCVKAVKNYAIGGWSTKMLGEGEGDCDPGRCKKGLICGVNNCRYMWRGKPEKSLFSSNDDCCFSRSEPFRIYDSIYYSENSIYRKWSKDLPGGPVEFCGGKGSVVRSSNNAWDFGVAGYATRFSLKIEGKQLLGDDTAANAICLDCSGGDYICSKIGEYGDWYYSSECSDGFTDAMVKNYPPKLDKSKWPLPKDDNGVDDTAISNVHLQCGFDTNDSKKKWMSTNGPDLWGDWNYKNRNQGGMCRKGSRICGIQATVEDGGVDKTGLQGVVFYCCTKEMLVCEPYEQHACYLAAIKNGLKHGYGKYKFASEDYGTPGCYTYASGWYKGIAFFGQRGSPAEKKASLSGNKVRVPGFDCKDIKVNNPFYNADVDEWHGR